MSNPQPEFLKRINVAGEKKKSKIIFYGDSPTCATGFGQVSRNILPALHNSGRYEVDILGINYWGDPHEYPFKIWPMAINNQRDPYGRQRLQQHLHDPRLDYDILFFLQDTFILDFLPNLIASLKQSGKKFKSVFYYPVDGIPKKAWIDAANCVDYPVTYSQFAHNMSSMVVPEIQERLRIMPHGVNPKVFFPASAAEVKQFRDQFFGTMSNRFIVTNVNRNQQRKDIPATIRAFKEFQKQRPESLLYLHMAAQDQGWNLPEVIKAFGLDITKDVILPQNFAPSAGFPLNILNLIYNASDAVISTAVGEGWGLCLDGNTQVLTTKGLHPIKNLSVGDRVVVGGGDYAIRGISSSTKKEAYTVTLFGNKELIGSREHQVPTANRGYVSLGEIVPSDWLLLDKAVLYPDQDYVYDLAEFADSFDDFYAWNKMGFSPRYENSISNTMKTTGETKKIVETAIKVFLDGKKTNSTRVEKVIAYLRSTDYTRPLCKLPRFITFNSEFARLAGYYAAEGSNEAGVGIEFAFHREESAYHADVQDLMYKFFGLEADVRVRENRCDLRYRSSILAGFFGELCGVHAQNKRVPLLCLQHREKAKQFIKGYWSGDGHFESNELSFSTASRRLMEELTWLLSGFDIFSKVNKRPIEQDLWSIYVNGEDYNLFAEVLDLPNRHNTFKNREYLRKERDCFLVQIKSVRKFRPDPDELFWDISVGSKEHFVANGVVVHNSWTEAMACKVPVIFPNNTCLGEYITEETGFPYASGQDADHITVLPNDNEVPRPTAHISEVVERLIQVHDNRDEAKKRAANAYSMVMNNLVWDKHVNPRWLAMFDQIIAEANLPYAAPGVNVARPVLQGDLL